MNAPDRQLRQRALRALPADDEGWSGPGSRTSCYDRVMTQSYDLPSPAAALIQLARLKAGVTQRTLAERASVPTTTISAYELDKRQPTIKTLRKLLNAAGFDLAMRLEPYDPHDAVLEGLESRRSSSERKRRDGQIEAWRLATPALDPA